MTPALVGATLFSIGLYGVLTRRDVVALLASVEVMLAAGLIVLVGMAPPIAGQAGRIESLGVTVLAVGAAETVVGLALAVAAWRRSGRTRLDDFTELRG